jgi:hypothetical protein
MQGALKTAIRTLAPAALLVLVSSACGGGGKGGETCDGVTCSGHGTCEVVDGEAVCVCDAAYAGEACEACANGYQDNDGDGTCRHSCGTAGLTCGAHAHCDDASGTAACVCDDGYVDHDGVCGETCGTAGLTCGAHAHCDDASGTPVCVCDDGYQDNDHDGDCAPDCETAGFDCGDLGCDDSSGTARCNCEAGYQDNDANGTCEPGCAVAALDCSHHGICDDASGTAICVCDEGYDRSDCGVCESAYYQDNDGDGVCSPTCYYSAATFRCGENQVCSHATGSLACVCADGYQDRDGNGSCLPTCRTAQEDETGPLVCPDPNGECDDESGTPACRCRTGYADDPAVAGADCRACASGYQDNDGDGTCLPDCATAAAGGLVCVLGCDDTGGTARCICVDGEQDNDGDGTCEPDCDHAGLVCDPAEHRTCVDGSGHAVCACDTLTYDDGMGTCRVVGDDDGDSCATAIDLDLTASVFYADMRGAGSDHRFGCDPMGFSFSALFYRIHVGPGETLGLRFTVDRVDATGASFTPAVAILEGATCDAATELACGSGFDPVTYTRTPAAAEATLDGGPSGTDYYLKVGLYDRRGRASRAVVTIEHLCDSGMAYSAALDACVDDPCGPANPCTAPHRSRCIADLSAAEPAYDCACDIGFHEDAPGSCAANASSAGDGCGDVAPLDVAASSGSVRGSTADAVDDGEGACSGDRPARDRVYGFALNQRTRASLHLSCDPAYDCLMHMRTACGSGDSEVLCIDTGAEGDAEGATVTLEPGAYYLFVDGWNSRDDATLSDGDYTLDYSFHTDPCADESAACPGEPVCTASSDWSTRECVCETAGEVLHGSSCVDDPCDPDPCNSLEHKGCVADLAAGTHTCVCTGIYVSDGTGGCALKPDAEWTIMWYLAMDNNLYAQSAHERDDVMAAGLSPDVRVVALVDSFDEPSGYYAEFGPGTMDSVRMLGQPDTGDWTTLSDFGAWAVESYPAQHYALVLSDHGGAWRGAGPGARGTPPALRAICWDDRSDTPDDGIGVANGQLAAALEGITGAAGRKLDLIVYDACLMGEWEVANVTEPYADYMIASPESNYGLMIREGGWTDWLDTIVAGADTLTPLDVGEAYVENYRATMATDPLYVTTIALTDLASVPALDGALTGFADALVAGRSETFYTALDDVRRGAQKTAYNELVDLEDFARLAAGSDGVPAGVVSAASALRTQFDASIIDEYTNIDLEGWSPYDGSVGLAGHNGLTVYLPSRYYKMDPAYTDIGAVWSARATWDEFLAAFLGGGYADCAGADPLLDYVGDSVTRSVGITDCCGSRYLVQTFLAPGVELHGVRIAVRKVSADGDMHEGFYFAIYRPDHGLVWGPAHWSIQANSGEPQYLCLGRMGLPTEPGEQLEILVGGGDAYPGAAEGFATPIQWPIEYAATAGSDPPYADGQARVIDSTTGEVTVGVFNGDNVEGTYWFQVY